jgi:hypothetical protein
MGAFLAIRRDLLVFSEKNFFNMFPSHTIKEGIQARPPVLTVAT